MTQMLFSCTEATNKAPLAHRVRPTCLEDFVGQPHLKLNKGSKSNILNGILQKKSGGSIILHGPPGCGKTTLALILSNNLKGELIHLHGSSCSISDIRNATIQANKNKELSINTVIFIDEIHRFNKAQQDSLLAPVEEGKFLLIGATTENPFFGITAPLVSRSLLVELKGLESQDIEKLLRRALSQELKDLNISEQAIKYISKHCGGDPRIALNLLELAYDTAEPNPTQQNKTCDLNDIKEIISRNISKYDRSGDNHYDQISAFIKSMRGSDPDASLYWLARMLYSGEDPLYIARRLIIHAAEDVGLADPTALQTAIASQRAVETVGLPEAQIPLAMATLHIALAPKSNSSCSGIKKAMEFVKNNPEGLGEVPAHLKDSHYKGAHLIGNGKDYLFPHDFPNSYVKQNYLPQNIKNRKLNLYESSNIGYESILNSNLAYTRQSPTTTNGYNTPR